MAASADTVFVVPAAGVSDVTAYDLRSGAVRWSTWVPTAHGRMVAQPPGALMVPVGRDGGAATVALDLRTGEQLWRVAGDLIDATPETALLAGPDATVRRVRMADGATIWSRPVDGAASWTITGHDLRWGRIVAARADGLVRTLRLVDGIPLVQRRLPNDLDVSAGNVGTVAGVVYVNRMETDRAVVTGYDLGTLDPRWRFAQASSDALPEGPAARTCGVVICFRDGTSTVGLDPGSATVRWRVAGWVDATRTADRSRLLADSPDREWHALIDSATGRIVAELGAGTAVWNYEHSTPTYYLRVLGSAEPGVLASRLNLQTGRLEPRGVLGEVGFPGCIAVGDHLICGTTDGHLAVTDLG
ncbi:outer membrane protein assembly factor BamB [Actinoplanes tereljensis]|nr:PQQ-binding-like beta-propeller repeat protein [Actinoplanes tereljensis]